MIYQNISTYWSISQYGFELYLFTSIHPHFLCFPKLINHKTFRFSCEKEVTFFYADTLQINFKIHLNKQPNKSERSIICAAPFQYCNNTAFWHLRYSRDQVSLTISPHLNWLCMAIHVFLFSSTQKSWYFRLEGHIRPLNTILKGF